MEQLASLRLTPNFSTGAPATGGDRRRRQAAIARQGGPTALILSRQNCADAAYPEQVQDIARGGYVLKDAGGKPDLILIATGSEVEITVPPRKNCWPKG